MVFIPTALPRLDPTEGSEPGRTRVDE
jgi:hypothetical protein